MTNTDANNQFLIDIQETEAKAEKMVQTALEKKHSEVASERAKAEAEKQKNIVDARQKHQTKEASEKTKAAQNRTKEVEKFKAETETFKLEKKSETKTSCTGAFALLLEKTAA